MYISTIPSTLSKNRVGFLKVLEENDQEKTVQPTPASPPREARLQDPVERSTGSGHNGGKKKEKKEEEDREGTLCDVKMMDLHHSTTLSKPMDYSAPRVNTKIHYKL